MSVVDPSVLFQPLAFALFSLAAGVALTLLVLERTRRSPLTLVATAVVLFVLFGPYALPGALLAGAAWLALRHRHRAQTPRRKR
jgi:hypothetical protein